MTSDPEKLAVAYRQLRKVVKAIYSGDVDPMINQIDYNKVKDKFSKRPNVGEQEMQLIEELVTIRKAHEAKKV